MLGIAQRYYALGFTPIPCEPRSKKPVCEWAQWQYRRPSWEELEVVWHNAIKRFGDQINIATILGKAHGLCAVDIDNPQAFRQARQAIGLTEDDLRTWITLSHRGGALIFRYPKSHDLPSKVSNEQLGAELHGDRHLRMLPPSIHPEGTPYRWLKGHEPDQIPLVDIPEPLLFAFIGERPKPTPRSVTPPQNGHGDGNELPSWAHAVVALLRPYWQEGWRHDTALALAGTLAKRGVPKEVAENILRELTREANDPEVKDRLRALMDTYDRLAEGESVLAWQGLERVLDEDTLKALDRLLPELPRNTSATAKDSGKPSVGLLTLAEWDERLAHISQGHWLVEGLLQTGWLLVINARPKVGKSIIAVNLATALAEGTPFLNLPTSPCAVLYIDLERPLETLNRFKALNVANNPNIFVPSERIGADMLETLRELIRQAKERTNRPVVLFADTLGDFIKPALRQRKASINDYDAITEILQELRNLALELGCAFVFVHHARKALSEEPTEVDVLGSTAIAGKFDVIAHLQPDRTDGSVLALTAEGNAIAKTTLHFVLNDGFRITPCEPPAKTKEEEVARLVLSELERHPDGLTYGALAKLIQDIGMANTRKSAEKLIDRASDYLKGHVVVTKVGRNTIYRLREHPALLTEVPELPTSDTYIENVGNVGNHETNAPNYRHFRHTNNDGDVGNVGSHVTTVIQLPTLPTNPIYMSDVGNPTPSDWQWDYIAGDVPVLPDLLIPENSPTPCPHDRIRSKNDVRCPSSFELPTNTPEPTEPAYTTPRGDELVDVLTTETPNTTLSDEVRYIDTEQWLEELCAELSETSNEPDDNTSSASQPKPDRLACLCGGELRLFGKFYQCLRCDSPRIAACRYCGKVLQLTSDSHAECVGCGLPYTFDRARRLWLSDLDAF
jgi:hypothetical protein